MNEASLTARLKARTEALLGPPVVFVKHHDESTIGEPDCSATWRRRTWWAEVKFVRPASTVRREVMKHPLQHAKMRLREMAGLAVYVVYHQHRKGAWSTSLWSPDALARAFEAGVADPIVPDLAGLTTPWHALKALGGWSVPRQDHDLLAALMRDFEARQSVVLDATRI